MKNNNLVLGMAALLAVIGAFFFLTRAPAPPPTSKTEPKSAESPTATLPAVTPYPAVAQTPTKPQPATTPPDPSVLATVNGVPIREEDLDRAGAAQPPDALARQAMLDRAIDRALIFQAAKEQGVRLTAEQERSLAELPAGVANSAALDPGKAPEAEARMQAEIASRAREAEAQFLLSTLAPPPDQEAYVKGLRAAAKIEIAK